MDSLVVNLTVKQEATKVSADSLVNLGKTVRAASNSLSKNNKEPLVPSQARVEVVSINNGEE